MKNDGLPAALRESQVATNVDSVGHPVGTERGRVARPLLLAFKIRFGRTLWRTLHSLADGWPCARCRPRMTVWMQGLHDAVNARLGKRPFRPDSFAQYASGALEGPYHPGCIGCRAARVGSRWIARAARPAPKPF
ncbi:MAG TPA: hypothetical protein VEO20_06620 [Thermoplasmata archaeon]|nr:hypothetical protein [Thermoplasmata archaeon]